MMHTLADIAIILGQSPELSLVVKMTIAAALGLAAVRFARATRASVRHLVLTSTFAALLALPLAMLIAPGIAIELPSASAIASPASTTTAAAANGAVGDVTAAAESATGSAVHRRADGTNADQNARAASAESGNGFVIWLTAVGRATGLLAAESASGAMASGAGSWLARASWLSIVRTVWFAGAALMLGMFAIALIRLRAVRRTGLPWLERRDDVQRLASETGVNRPVTVMFHERIATPLTCGWRNPVILFPTDAREWSDGDVRRVLLHELEHVRRGDWLVLLAARAICAIYWFHPLVWMAWRQLCLEAERACDDAVVRSEAETDYAEQLVQLARRMSDASTQQPMVAMASRSDLSARVTALLDARQQRGRAGIMTFLAAAGAAAFIVITIGPLRAVAATEPQAGDPVVTGNGRGSGSGAGAGVGRGAGRGSGGSGASGSSAVSAGVPGGIAGGVAGGEPGGVAGGVSGGVAVGGPGAEADDKRRSSGVARALGEALIEAASEGDMRAIAEVLEAGVDVNLKVDGDGSAMIAAARSGQIAAMKYLLERGADVNMGVEGDGNPLIAAAARGQIAAVTLLLELGADIEAVVDGDENALIQAAGNGHLDVVKLLVAKGANVNARIQADQMIGGKPSTEWRTPLGMARRGGHRAVAAFLQSAGAVE